MFVCCECCVLSGRGLCDELITRPKESYRLWCVVVCDVETSCMRRPWPTGGCRAKTNKQTKQTNKQTNKLPSHNYVFHVHNSIAIQLLDVTVRHSSGFIQHGVCMCFESAGILRTSSSLGHLPVTCKVIPKLAASHDADPIPSFCNDVQLRVLCLTSKLHIHTLYDAVSYPHS